jgi:hypothetical protein
MKRQLPIVILIVLMIAGGCARSTEVSRSQVSNMEWSFTQAGQHPEKQLIEVIDSAKASLDVAIYSLTYPGIVDAVKKAKQRGVKVRLITDSSQSAGKTQKEALKLLGSAGVPIKTNRHSGLMHLKMTVADGRIATTGSFNYSKSASTTNDEMLVVFRDEAVAQSFAAQFERMWNDERGFETLDIRIAQADNASEATQEPGQQEAEVAACPNPRIKGNINAKGDKIFHVPGGRYYDGTKAERMFCSEQEAQDAGFRKSGK